MVVTGIGINIAAKPEGAPYAVTCLADHGAPVSPEEMFAHLYMEMREVLLLWNGGAGAAAIVEQWRRAACGIGERITVNLQQRSVSGLFTGIDAQGFLILDTGGETMSIAAGDVFFS